MHLSALFAVLSLVASAYAARITSTVYYGYCWNYQIVGSATRYLPGTTETSLIPTPTTQVLTRWIFQEGNPPPDKRQEYDAPQLPARTAAPEEPGLGEYAKRYPPLIDRDSVDVDGGADSNRDLTVVVTQTCTSTITLSMTRTLSIPDPTITASTIVWAATITEWVTATSYCGPNNMNC